VTLLLGFWYSAGVSEGVCVVVYNEVTNSSHPADGNKSLRRGADYDFPDLVIEVKVRTTGNTSTKELNSRFVPKFEGHGTNNVSSG
jgi:hypothetical protein